GENHWMIGTNDGLLEGFIDISPLISENIAVFPGDKPYLRTLSCEFKKGDHLTLSSVQTTVHVGAHTDAPVHYHRDGEGIDRRSLNYYAGRCQVMTVKVTRGSRITVDALEGRNIDAPRVLFHTGSFPDPNCWTGQFNSLSAELIDYL